MSELVSVQQSGEVAVVTVNNPPVNALSTAVAGELQQAILRAAADPAVITIVVAGAGRTFIAGADIKEITRVIYGEQNAIDLLAPLLEIENVTKPVVMAIHGMALGGGLEFAMAGHYRVATPDAQVGQPEVKLGLIPGAAGTQRLPRLAGVPKAVEMCAFGNPIGVQEALTLGIIDQIITGDDFLKGAVAFAREVTARPIPKTRDLNGKLSPVDESVFSLAKEQARTTLRGQTAPLLAIDAIQAATRLTFEQGCACEQELFAECLRGPQSKAMLHAFFGERTVAKVPGLGATPPADIKRAAVIGAGTMGAGIAMTYANAGIPVLLKDSSDEPLQRGLANIRKNYESTVRKGRMSEAAMAKRLALITPQLTYDGFDQVDIITEAVFESMAVKKAVFAEMDAVAGPQCVLASNTSSLDIDELAAATRRPGKVVGHHYFSPANVMRLLEVVRGKATSNDVLASSMALAKRLKKVGVVAGNAHGFIGNRMIAPYLREAEFLVEEGTTVEQVNTALYDFGMAMGPLAMSDLAGVDVSWRVRNEARHLEQPGVRQPVGTDVLYEQGRFGQKTGRGWSLYGSDRRPMPDSAIEHEIRTRAGQPQRQIDTAEIVERCVLALVNEGARLLEEGIALRPVDIDIVYLTGYGFPIWRGGPMFYADSLELAYVVERIEAQQDRNLWGPAPLLRTLAREGRTFGSLNPATGS